MNCKNCGHKIMKDGDKWVHLTKLAKKDSKWIVYPKHLVCLNIVGLRSHCGCTDAEPEKEVKRNE